MNEKVPQAFGVMQNVLAEFEHFSDVIGLGGPKPRRFLDDVVKFKLQPRVLSVRSEGLRLSLIRVQDGKDMAHLTVGMSSQFLQPAHCDHEGRIDWRHPHSFRSMCCPMLLLYRNSDGS